MNKEKLIVVGCLGAIFLAIGALSVSVYALTSLVPTAEAMKTRIEALEERDVFADQGRFEGAVLASINRIAAREKETAVMRKYDAFMQASETSAGKHIYGNVEARFTLVVFSDLECPYCKRFHENTIELVNASKGNVNLQWKHLPLSFHNPVAMKEAVAAECIAEEKGNRGFWVFIDDIFRLSQGNGAGVADLASVVEGVGSDVALFRDCLASERFAEKVQHDIKQATELGISGTPATFVVDNYTGQGQLLNGAQPSQAIIGVIRKMMAEAAGE